ncbi:tubulin-tyrosine ligase [Artomyces pyxidatus]|uniref:Tubulin-tyrosine ligase n=1 Tax=Artomyces pyxidatus TaxID=48021 RepID=A0ACB8TJ62_9AGAM|nr:tubulin-tyrosine ligase [Artomyces pyxidatus]
MSSPVGQDLVKMSETTPENVHVAFVSWPSAPLTHSLVSKALSTLQETIHIASVSPHSFQRLLQWSTYDTIDHDLTHSEQHRVLSSSHIIRKALIRKHFLARCIHEYLVKHPTSILRNAVPQTWDLEISFADELDDMWADDLWELSEAIEGANAPGCPGKWWILKPGMADRGMGIRLFNSKESLQRIFEEFEENEEEVDDGVEDDEADVVDNAQGRGGDTAIVVSQLRHFVIQEYISAPLLLDPYQVPLDGRPSRPLDELEGHKFHLRVYCVASGALKVYVYNRILALFSSKPYSVPASVDDEESHLDLAPHLTNTSLQTHRGEEGVRILDELIGCHILSGVDEGNGQPSLMLTSADLTAIQDQIADTIAETFRAALQSPVHFQVCQGGPLPNAFELYGIDFLVAHAASPGIGSPFKFQLKLLEINAEPAIELTGPRLTWILEDLFNSIAKVCVSPFFHEDLQEEGWAVGETRHHLRNCLDVNVRGPNW